MIDIYAVHTASKCSWLKRLFDQSDSKWKKSMWYMLNVDTKVLNKNYNNRICKRAKSNFHQQILQLWPEVHETIPTNKTDILNEYIIYNKNILLNKKMLEPTYFGKDSNQNIKIMDIYTKKGLFQSKPLIEDSLGTKLATLQYNTLKTIVPTKWRKIIKLGKTETTRSSDNPLLKINTLWKPLKNE